jgi:hypothetical protein
VSTPEPAVVVETAPDTALVFMTTSLFAFPGESEADTWLKSQRDGLIAGGTTSAGTFTDVPEAPSLGDAAATFATRRMIEADNQAVGGFRLYSRLGAIVVVLQIESSSDLPMDGAARLMRFQLECIERRGCMGLASVPQNLFGNEEEPVAQRLARSRPEESEPPPVEQPASAPIQEPPPAPIEEPAPAAVEEPTLVPAEEPAPAPIEEPTAVPIEEPVAEPSEAAPIEAPVPATSEEPTPAPGEEPTPAPTAAPAPEGVDEPVPAAGEEPAPAPSEDPVPPASADPAPATTEAAPPLGEDDASAPDGGREAKPGRNARERIRDWKEEHAERSGR